MTQQDHLKKAFESALGQIQPSEALIQRTLERARRRNKRRYGALAASAAVLAAVIVIAGFGTEDWFPGRSQPTKVAEPSQGVSSNAFKAAVPSYIPPSYEMKEVESALSEEQSVPDITMLFLSAQLNMLELRQSGSKSHEQREGFVQVTIDGNQGWYQYNDQGDIILIWEDHEREYTIKGKLTAEEAIKMAESVDIPLEGVNVNE